MSLTIYVREGDQLVNLDSLSEKEECFIGHNVFKKLADGLMEPDGYRRVGEFYAEKEKV